MTHDVFISYSRADAKIADDICTAFDGAGISYWIDRGGIAVGEAFHAVIVRAIKESRITVFISSVNSNMSEYTIKEIVIAFKNKKHIIPFCLDEEPFADRIEFYLCDLDQLQYYLHREFAIQKLVGDINRILGRKETSHSTPPEMSPTPAAPDTQAMQYFLKIRPNLACQVFVDGEPKTKVEADKIIKLPLNRGTFFLEFVSVENEADKYSCEYRISDMEELFSVDLLSIKKERERLEKLELERFEDNNGKYGFKDRNTGEIVIPLKYDIAWPFSEGLAGVKLNDNYGFIDKTGKEVIPLKYDFAWTFSEGLAGVELNDNCGFIDKIGKEIIPLKYDRAKHFSEGIAGVQLNGKWGFIDKTDREMIPFKYDNVWSFTEGLAGVELNGKWGFIDKTGKEITLFKYDYASSFSEGLALVQLNGKWGFIDKTDKAMIPFKYDYAYSFSEGLALVQLNGKRGFIDKTGKEIIPLKYDKINNSNAYDDVFFRGRAKVKLNNEEFYIDKQGNRIN
ncbi:MAG: WG repeat-containing protein [Tannerella sp.]|jgi:hypothetical protein|nr:WG repeat-containing protein [Tannerella sp.]